MIVLKIVSRRKGRIVEEACGRYSSREPTAKALCKVHDTIDRAFITHF